MKVVHVFKDYFPPTTGGIEQHMQLLCGQLARQLDVTVLVPSRSRTTKEESLENVRVIRVPEFGRYASAPLCPTLPWRLRTLRPDLVHVHFPNPAGDLGYLLSGCDAPLVITYHADIVKQRALLPFYRPVLRRILGQARRIIATSADYIDSSAVLAQYREKCAVIPYGLDVRPFALRPADSEKVEAFRQRFGRRVLVFVGVLRYYKGVEVLLRAMTTVDAHLVIVGDGGLRDHLEALARDLHVEHRVTFLGELTTRDQLRVVLHGSDVFVFPSIDRCEAFGIAQLEAMACGKPVVSTDLPTGVRFVNRHEITGLTVPPGDVQALAAALNRLLDDRALRARFGDAGRRRVERDFDVSGMVARTVDLYEDVLRNPPVS